MALPKNLEIRKDRVTAVLAGLEKVTTRSVLVGIPSEKTTRSEGAGSIGSSEGEDSPITNAALGFIHEHGAPDVGIPARPWLHPSIRESVKKFSPHLQKAAQATIDGDDEKADQELHKAGLIAMTAAQNKIVSGPFVPLADSTLKARARRKRGTGVRVRKGALKELASRAAGNAPGTAWAKPLNDTAQMRRSVSYVVRKKAG